MWTISRDDAVRWCSLDEYTCNPNRRPPPPLATKRIKNWQDLEAMQAQTFSLKPQKDSNVKKISVEESAMDDFVG